MTQPTNLDKLKETAREKYIQMWAQQEVPTLNEQVAILDEIVTSTYLRTVWEMGAWIEEQDFARKVGEKTGNAEAVYEMQDVIKKIQNKLQSLKQTKDI